MSSRLIGRFLSALSVMSIVLASSCATAADPGAIASVKALQNPALERLDEAFVAGSAAGYSASLDSAATAI